MAEHTEDNAAPLIGRLEALTAIAVVGLLALVVGLVALAIPTTKASSGRISYAQSGRFSYHASAPSSSVYGAAGLTTGEPIASNLVRNVTMGFAYRLASKLPASTHGTQSLLADVKLNSGLNRQFVISPQHTFTGSTFTATGVLPLQAILRYVNASSTLAGTIPSAATVSIVSRIATSGSIGGRSLATTYAPALPFSVTGKTLTVSETSTTSSVVRVGSGADAALTPSQGGSLTYRTRSATTVPLLVAHPAVKGTREVALAIAALCLLVGLLMARPLMGRGSSKSERDRIRALYGSMILPVRSMDTLGAAVAEVTSMAGLAELAKRYESMIMHRRGADRDDYMVWDNGMLYRHTVMAAQPTGSKLAEDSRPQQPMNPTGFSLPTAPHAPVVSEPGELAPSGTRVPGDSVRRLRRGRRRASV